MTLVLRNLDGGGRGDVCVVGPRMRALFKRPSRVARAVVLRLRPGWSVPLLGVAADELAGQVVPLEELWGRAGRELAERALASAGSAAVVERASLAIDQRMQAASEPSAARIARRGLRLIEEGEDRVSAVAERLGVTPRHLRRAFKESVGIGPKEFARTVRLQRALELSATTTDWSQVATAAGYYDQAHLIGEFQKLVGLTPSAYLRR